MSKTSEAVSNHSSSSVQPDFASDTAAALQKSPVPRYLQLASMFRSRIETGEWAIGSMIPPAKQLAAECGVALMTLRQAMDILEDEGLITRQRAKGTFIRAAPKRDLWCKVNTDWSGLLTPRDNAVIDILKMVPNVQLPPHESTDLVEAQAYRHVQRRHSRETTTYLLADIFIAEDLADQITIEDYKSKTAIQLVAELPNVTVANAWQIITIEVADLNASTELNLPLGAPIGRVVRIVADENGRLILMARQAYRGDLFRIEISLLGGSPVAEVLR